MSRLNSSLLVKRALKSHFGRSRWGLVLLLWFILLILAFSGCAKESVGLINWERLGGGLEKVEVNSLVFSQSEGSLYVGTNQRGIWCYDGTKWAKLGDELDDATVFFLIEGGRGIPLYAGAGERGVWRYKNGGWEDTSCPDDSYTLALNVGQSRLYSGSNREVWMLEGETWRSLGELPVMRIYRLYFWEPQDMLLAGTDDGLWAYAGQIWIRYGETLKGKKVKSLTGDGDSMYIYAGTEHDGIWYGHGQDWRRVTEKTFTSSALCLYYDQVRGILFAGTEYGVWVYDGNEWVDSSGRIKELDITAIAFDGEDMSLYVGAFQDHGVWRGDTSGLTEIFAEQAEKKH